MTAAESISKIKHEWLKGFFLIAIIGDKDKVVSGEFVYERWGIRRENNAEESRRFWSLTHLPTGYRIVCTTEKSDAKLMAELCDGITDWLQITTIEAAQPYKAALACAFQSNGFHYHGGVRWERLPISNNNGESPS